MLNCQHPDCEFKVTDEFHFNLHNSLNHTVFQTVSTQNLINQIIKQLVASNDSLLEIKLNRSDFLKRTYSPSKKKACVEVKEENITEPTGRKIEQNKSRLIHNSRLSSGNITQVGLKGFCF